MIRSVSVKIDLFLLIARSRPGNIPVGFFTIKRRLRLV